MLASALISSLLAIGEPSTDAPRPVAMLLLVPVIITAEGRDLDRRAVIDAVEHAAADRARLHLISDEELFVSGLAQQRLKECGADTACLASELRPTGASFGLIVLVNLIVEPPLIAMRVIDVGAAKIVADEASPPEAGEADVADAVSRRAERIFDRLGYERAAKIVVTVEPSAARVRVDGAGDAARTFYVAPGRHRVTAELEGYEAAHAEIDAKSGAGVAVHLQLEPQASLFRSPWLWIGAGATVAAIVATALIVTHTSTPCVCVGGRAGAACPDC